MLLCSTGVTMILQRFLLDTSTALRAHASAFATSALDLARAQAQDASPRVKAVKQSIATLSVASRELNRMAKRHAARLVKENSAIAVSAGRDLSALARSTYSTLTGRKPRRPARTKRVAATRKRASAKAA
jgi:hypothetical protein